MELMSVTGMQLGVLAVLLMVVAMGGFIAGVKVTNHEHRRDEATRRPWVPPVPQYAATRLPEPPAPAGAVVHVHLPAMPTAWSQPPVLNGQVIPALAEWSDR